MPPAHKPATRVESDFNKTQYCSVCGQEDDLSGPCYGSEIERKFINEKMENDFRKIFDG